MSLALANTFSPCLCHLCRSQRHGLPLDGASPVANADSLPIHGPSPGAWECKCKLATRRLQRASQQTSDAIDNNELTPYSMQGVLARIAESQITGEILPWKFSFPEVAVVDPTQTRVFTDLPEPPTTMRRPQDEKIDVLRSMCIGS